MYYTMPLINPSSSSFNHSYYSYYNYYDTNYYWATGIHDNKYEGGCCWVALLHRRGPSHSFFLSLFLSRH